MVLKRCIRCGREVEGLVEGRLCPDCYIEVYGLGTAPRTVEVTICPRCGAYRYRGEWYEPGGESLEDLVAVIFASEFKPSSGVEKYWVESVRLARDTYQGVYAVVEVKAALRGAKGEYVQEYIVPVRVHHMLCPKCLRKASGAPLAVVQVRSWSRRLSEEEKALVERVIGEAGGRIEDSIIDVESLREGIDIKMTDHETARALAARLRSRLGAKITESYKVIGRERSGKPRTRLTLSVRLPYFQEGAMVGYEGRLGVVERIRGGRVEVRLLGGGLKRLTVEEAWKKLEKPEPELLGRGVVVAVEPEWIHVQLLDKDYKYLELPLERTVLEGPVHEGAEVKIYKYRGREYIIGEEEKH